MEDRRAQELVGLFNELCVDLGFCLSSDDRERLSLGTWGRAGDLTDAVFAAEGMTLPYDLKLWRQVHDRVARHF